MKRCLMAAFIKFTKRGGRGVNRGKAGGWACALLDEDRYCAAESEEGGHCGRIYGDLPAPDSPPACSRSLQVIARELEKLMERNVPAATPERVII